MKQAINHFVKCTVSLLAVYNSALLPAAETTSADASEQGWVSTIKYTPKDGMVYELGSMRDGRIIPVFLGIHPGTGRVLADGKKYKITINNFKKTGGKSETYTYQYKDIYKGTDSISRKNMWEFSIKKKITALRDLKLQWYENYLNTHLIAGRDVFDQRNNKIATISKEPLPTSKMFKVIKDSRRFKELSFDAVIGKIDIKFSSKMMLVDHRAAPWRRADNAHLFYNEFNLKKGESIQLDIQVKITPDYAGLKRYQPIAAEKDVYTSKQQLPARQVIIPSPKTVTWMQGNFKLAHKASLFHNLRDSNITQQAKNFFAEMFQLDLQVKPIKKQLKNCLVLSNKKLPGNVDKVLAKMLKKVAKLNPEGSYVLRVTSDAIMIAGKSEQGVWNGLMTLFQLSRHQVATGGITYAQVNIADYPDFDYRGIYVRIQSDLDYAWSRRFVAVMAELKYNQVYLHFANGIGVRFNSQSKSYDRNSASISTKEFAEFVHYIKSFNMEIIPIWAAGKTMLSSKHFKQFPKLAAMTINKNKNWDISLDEVFEYHKSILDEIIELTGTKTVHLGMDEIYHFARYCRNNTGRGDLILANYINKFTDYYAPRGIRTIMYHDMLVKAKDVSNGKGSGYFAANAHEGSEKALALLRNRQMLTIENWSYSENEIYVEFDHLLAKGLNTYASCWYRYENIIGLSAYTKGRSNTFVCTYWSSPRTVQARGWDPRGARSLNDRFKTYKFLPAMGLGSEAAWNGGKRDLAYNFLEETLRLFNQRKGLVPNEKNCVPFDLSGVVNRDLTDAVAGDGVGFIDQGRTMAMGSFPSGKQFFGGIPFLISKNKQQQACAVALKGYYTKKLPQKIRIPVKAGKYVSLVFLHTCHFDFEAKNMHKALNVNYIVNYKDGTNAEIKLINDENIMAWAPALTRFNPDNNSLWLAWVGMTKDNLPTAVYGYSWNNPQPQKVITSIELQADADADASLFLIAITGIKK
ncbi:MAG: beta-N-acetylhexosaminidase [Victivallaceae bacterium]|nr:beta-N-acetylhexosaminidase [Victivallaceae bacterium]